MKNLVLIIFGLLVSFQNIGRTQADDDVLIIARNTGKKILSNGDTIRTMGFTYSLVVPPNIPGPTLEFYEGDSIYIDLWNVSQGAPHTIHLHGLDVNQENDGVPHLSFDVHHMDHGIYRFKAPHPGTYFYHCHVVSPIHVQGGMWGAIIIHPKDLPNYTWVGGYEYEFDSNLLFNEIDTIWHNDTIIKHDTTSMFVEIPEYHPQHFLVNGLANHQITDSLQVTTAANAVTYIRLGNMGFYGNEIIFPSEFDPVVIDSDGRPLPITEVSDTVRLLPGERYGVLGVLPDEGVFEITVNYFNLNTGIIEDTQFVPMVSTGVSGTMDINKISNTYPNPSKGNFTVEHKLEQATIEVYNLQGILVQKVTSSYRSEFDFSRFARGTYYIVLTDDSGERKGVSRIILN